MNTSLPYNIILCIGIHLFTISTNKVSSQDCDCKEYIYLNEPNAQQVHKLEVLSDGTLSEVFGGANQDQVWYPGDNISELPSPHGLGTDLNGFLYIGATSASASPIRRLRCDGEIFPTNVFSLENTGTKQNIFSIGSTLYNNTEGGPSAWDICSGMSLGKVCLNESENTNLWGLHYNPITELFYATSAGEGNEIWVWDQAQNEQSLAGNLCIDPLTDLDGRPNLFGITSDSAENIYVVSSNLSRTVFIYKLDSSGTIIDSVGPSSLTDPWAAFAGIVFSEDQQRLYVSNFTGDPNVDCVSMFNTDLDYVGTGLPNPTDGSGEAAKAIAIIKECCPTVELLELGENICSNGDGEKIFLQEVFTCGEGIVCEGMWTVETPNTMQVFDDCDLSITVNGSGCGTYVLEKTTGASGAQQCGVFRVELEVCTVVPTTTLTTSEGTCTEETPNNDAIIDIENVMNADQAGISIGSIYSGPVYSDAANLDISGGTGSFNDLMHGTEYTVRIFNGSNDCFVDYTVTTPDVVCAPVCEIDAISMTSNQCVDNATPGNPSDDRVQVGIFVSGTGSTFTLSVDGGTTITPSSGTIGSPGFFMLGPGTAGSGNTYTIIVEDAADPGCNQTLVVQAPENCDTVLPCPTADCGGVMVRKND